MDFALYCTCGAAWKGTVMPEKKVEAIRRVWTEVHSGPGHAACDAKTAARARAKAEQESEAEQ